MQSMDDREQSTTDLSVRSNATLSVMLSGQATQPLMETTQALR